jgi:hypothetical protein
VGRHSVASNRRKSPAVLAALAAPAAVFFAVGAEVQPRAADRKAEPVVEDAMPCCMEIVSAPVAFTSGQHIAQVAAAPPPPEAAASRYRIVERYVPSILPRGVAPEQGLQVKTVLAARSISAMFPEIQNIGGVRPDSLRWHPNGLALDVMIPNPGSDAGVALGNQIVDFVLNNAERFGLQDAIWRGVYYTPGGARSGGYGHYDHVHITTTGGGYPTGSETYYR